MIQSQLKPVLATLVTPDSTREAEVLRAIRDTRFGIVEIVVHQSRIVQITRSEKVRFER